MSNRNEKLVKNVLLFAIGNIGSKLLQIILVPLYTRVMSSAEYGTVDIMQAVVSLLIPIFSFTIYEAVFRYAMEQDYDKRAVFSTGIVMSLLGAVILSLGSGVASLFIDKTFVWLVAANSVVGFFRSLLSQYARAVEKTVLFTVDSVLLTVFVLILNVLFIVHWKMGITGYMLGYILANLLSCIFLYAFLGPYRKFSLKSVTKPLAKEMMRFSLPLIPNAVCWWVSSFIDRIIITAVVGEAANGIYAAGHKIPSMLTVIVTIFFQAWQMSANQEFKKKDVSDFYTAIHDQIFSVITLVSSFLILFCKPITSVFLGAEYYSAWQVMPLLLVAISFFSFAQFLGSIYSANKKTTMALVTNLIGVGVSLTVNLLLVAVFKIGILGSAIATVCSYLVLWCVRIVSTGKIVPLYYKKKKMVLATVILTAQAIVVTLDLNSAATYAVSTLALAALIVIFVKDIIGLVNFALGFVKKIVKRGA
ncbi:MAG: oligosaccharide flippase family protein [Clostridia bacterium]|nr:oligosaccharide flippase family protein [Clostridia bacterium]